MNRRWARATATLAGALALLALWLAVAPVRVPLAAVEASPLLLSAEPTSSPGLRETPDVYEEVVAGNILSPARRAPAARRTPRDETGAAPASDRTPNRRLRLSGIVRGPDGVIALIDADPAVPGAELYRLGDRVGPYRLVEATDSAVVLRGASGALVLRLDSLPGRIP